MTNATASGLTLGSTSNLLNGFQAVWDRSDSTKTPLYLSKNQPLNPENISLQSKGKDWGQIEITLCDSANDVITELYSYDVLQLANDTTDYPSGALVLDNYNKAAIYKSIQTLTGIDFSASAGGYALITIKREEGTQQYSQGGMHAVSSAMSEQFSKITKQLAAPLGTGPASLSALGGIMSGLTQDDVQLFMSFFEDYGSHYVSGVTTGDVIYQIFAYDSDNYSTIKQYYTANPDKLYGTSALSFQAYTNPVHQTGGETYGYASQVGTLTTISGDSSFAKSVANKNWYDSTYKVTSILMQILNNPDLTVYNEVVTIGISLTELLDIVSFRMQITANRIFKALMYTKYAEDIDADFRNIAPYDYSSIFPDSVIPGMVSYLATTDINVYKERLDLSEVLVVVPSEVKNFNLMTQVSQMVNAAQFVCPGNSVSLLAHTFDFSSGNHPSIQLTDTAFSTAEIACQYFWGDLTIKNTTGTSVKTIIDGFSYQITSSTVFSGKNTVEITGSVRQSPSSTLITNNVDNIELSIAAAEFILNAAAGTPQAGARNLMLDYLNWIGNAIPTSGNNDELKMRALYLARISAQLNFQGKSVPLLTYAAYSPMSTSLQNALNTIQTQIMGIQSAIQSRKLQEQMVKDTEELKKGIEQTGNEVACLIQAQMQNEELVSSYYGSIVSSQQTSLDQLKDTIKTLQQSLALQKGVVNGLVASFKDAAANCEISEILSDVLDLAKNIFSLGKDIAAPELAISDVVKDLFDTAKSIQTLMNAISEFADLDGQIGDLTDKLNSLGGLGANGVSILSLTQWETFKSNFTTALNNEVVGMDCSGVTTAKNNLQNAFDILVLRGEAIVNAQVQLQQQIAEAYLNKKRQDLSSQQASNFGKLPFKCSQDGNGGGNGGGTGVDPTTVDMMQLTSTLLSSQKRMGAMLAKVLALQNSAILYEYPETTSTQITNFDLISLSQAIVSENASIVNGISNSSSYFHSFKPNNGPIEYTIKSIPITSLTNGNEYQFQIPLSASEFAGFNMVRVNQVVADISGIKSTTGGEYQINLAYDGHPFWDRSKESKILTFHTPSRYFDFLYYCCKTGQESGCKSGPAVGNNPFGANISPITPFSNWRVSLPKSTFNDGIEFSEAITVDITLSFYGNYYLPPAVRREVPAPKPAPEPMPMPRTELAMAMAPPPKSPTPDTTTNSTTSTDILNKMYKSGTVMNGWDAVFNITESKVNTILSNQWNNRNQAGTNFKEKIPMNTFISPIEAKGGSPTITVFEMDLGSPEIAFQSNSAKDVNLKMQLNSMYYGYGVISATNTQKLLKKGGIIPSKYVTGLSNILNCDPSTTTCEGMTYSGNCSDLTSVLISNGAMMWITPPPKTVALSAPKSTEYLKGTVPLDKLSGVINSSGSVISSSTKNSVILNLAKGAFDASDITVTDNNPSFPTAVKQWMASNAISFTINILDLTNIKGALLPSLTPKAFTFNTLTPNGAPAVLQVFISTGSDSLENNNSLLLPNPIPNGQDVSLLINSKILYQDIFVKSYQAANNPSGFAVSSEGPNSIGVYSAKLTSGSISVNVPAGDHWRLPDGNTSLSIDFTGMTFAASSGGNIQASFTDNNVNQDFSVETTSSTGMYGITFKNWNSAKLNTNIVINFGVPFKLSGSGKSQTVQLNPDSADISPTLTVTSVSGQCNDKAKDSIQKELNTFAQNNLPGPITNATSIQFGSVSLFALESILFPSDNLISLSDAYAPSDLIIFGTLNITSGS